MPAKHRGTILCAMALTTASLITTPARAEIPTAQEQLWLELTNRFRANPAGELDHLTNYLTAGGNAFASPASDDPRIASAINFFNVDAAILRAQFNALTPAPPLAWSFALNDSANSYSNLMIANDQQSHTLDGLTLFNRITSTSSYDFTGGGAAAENIFTATDSVSHGNAAFIIDWGNTPTGIQNPPGHRNALVNSVYNQIGIAIVPNNNPATNVGPLVVTQHLAVDFADGPFLTGIAYNDTVIDDNFYSIGEGLGGLTIDVFNAGTNTLAASATTYPSGGFNIELPAAVYNVRVTGGGVLQTFLGIDLSSGQNARLEVINPVPEPHAALVVVIGAMFLNSRRPARQVI